MENGRFGIGAEIEQRQDAMKWMNLEPQRTIIQLGIGANSY